MKSATDSETFYLTLLHRIHITPNGPLIDTVGRLRRQVRKSRVCRTPQSGAHDLGAHVRWRICDCGEQKFKFELAGVMRV